MPSEQSLYVKLQEVLEVSRSTKVDTLGELREEITAQKNPIFQTRQFDAKRDRFVDRISERVIKQTIKMCRLLGLIIEDGSLTTSGRQALQRGRFDRIVANKVRRLLKENGVDLVELNRAIQRKLQSKPPVLPTSRELWETAGGSSKRGMFTRMLTLLTHCGGAKSSQNKIYLHIDQR